MGETKAQQAPHGANPQRMAAAYENEECWSYATVDFEEEEVLDAKQMG